MSLYPTADMMLEFTYTLMDMESKGLGVDLTILDEVEKYYIERKDFLDKELTKIERGKWGEKPFNRDSPWELSQFIYSKKLREFGEDPVVARREARLKWKTTFNLGSELRGATKKKKYAKTYPKAQLIDIFKRQLDTVYKWDKGVCPHCVMGKVQRVLKNGKQGKPINCKACGGEGYRYTTTGEVAGLKCKPAISSKWVSVNGFTTGSDFLELLMLKAKDEAFYYLKYLSEYNQISTYLDTFIKGIRAGMVVSLTHTTVDTGDKDRPWIVKISKEALLHPNFNQTTTSTGRLSSSKPNLQNFPRGDKSLVRKVFVSKFYNGLILEADAKQLEFRVAAELSGCPVAYKDIINNVDIHRYTASIIFNVPESEVTKAQRQEAKAHTFKPLYGGMLGTEEEQAYYKAFAKKYSGITEWQKTLMNGAWYDKKVTLPSGREYDFKHIELRAWGVTNSTQIKNYPVQGYATGDIIPVMVIAVNTKLKGLGLQSHVVNTVHDSIVIDVHPDELQVVANTVYNIMCDGKRLMRERYGVEMKIPFDSELKIGYNWLETKDLTLKDEVWVW